jgi:urease accessory protein
LEWWPDPLIPYAGTSVQQEIEIVADERATVLVADCWLAGRVARGEVHHYDRLALTASARRLDGALIFRDSLRIEPTVQPPSVLGLIADARAVGSYFLLGPGVAPCLEGPLAEMLGRMLPGRAACSRLPNGAGLFARALAATSDDLRRVQREMLGLARHHLFGRSAGHAYKP